jgi:hypothetical protein
MLDSTVRSRTNIPQECLEVNSKTDTEAECRYQPKPSVIRHYLIPVFKKNSRKASYCHHETMDENTATGISRNSF